MYCPKCKSEYREEFTTCPDCNEPLVKQLMEEKDIVIGAIDEVKLLSAANEVEAELIMNLLKSNDISCFKKSKGMGGYMNVYMGYSVFGEDIYVDQTDYDRAKDILDELQLEEDNENEVNDEKEEVETLPFYRRPQIVARIILIVMVIEMIIVYIINHM
ncbi:putative signal transducing protein [Anaeromicropila herbilytica]|uniref:DUF2007 domain-containing protein n=1 Tax=Anaeromicropila herbilytica TaxID=2785025 RepID=A0A7R7IEQ1_9FIRM|nr:DUF2007 domain-containing protein [Anaeromicropila herbilytica]BCN31343.1 hypothetical protein bsdtb5_26380 [Anaeromicropila herbilytica]